MEQVLEILKQLQNTSSINEKVEIIKRNKDNELFKECLKFLFDTNIVTGISDKKINKEVAFNYEGKIKFLNNFSEVMEYLKQNNTGKDEDILIIQIYIFKQPEQYQEMYKQLITKSLKLGCDSKLVNKAIPKLIPTWEVQLGSAYDKLKLKKDEWFSLSQKLNGNRNSYINDKLLSRQGKEFKGLEHIIDDIKVLGLDNYFIDGELVGKNLDNISDGENFRRSTGIINSDLEVKDDIKFVIFDLFPANELQNGQSINNYKTRKAELLQLKEKIKNLNLQNIDVVEMLYEGTDTSQIDRLLDYAVKQDWEGLMLNKNTTYECKRTTNLIKIKRFYTMDLEIVGVEEGSGKLTGTLGALVVKFKNNVVNVGSGFDDETRKEFWINRDNLIGRIAEVKYKEITKDKKTDLESLQFPVFVQLREMGKTVSYD